ncbi:MAG: protein kinase [Desulfobacterota bacterium]|jgi:serine/threonine-protein kinase|nr:protein kinase [Thermodesulfobacteriota bacterium]
MRHIGRYEILGLLGRGGMSLVYKVRLPVIEKIMALKRFHPRPLLVDLLGAPELKRRFVNEAQIMARLHHPHLLAVWDYDEAAGTPFFVMEYYCNNLGALIGESGEAERTTRRLDPGRVQHYGRQILQGVVRLHQVGIIHRDLKPFNFLITDDDIIKIGDFGLSLLRGETLPAPHNLKVGSPYYAAPEQEQDPNRVDARADIYSVGVTLYRLATGRLPAGNRGKPSRCHPELDARWDDFLLKATAPDGTARFASAAEMLLELEALEPAGKDRLCPKNDAPASAPFVSPARLRSTPVKVRPAESSHLFPIDALGRPRGYPVPELREMGNGTVLDQTHALIWEQSGSAYPLTWPEAGAYARDLNRQRFAGRLDWRLPTVDELLSLITERPQVHSYCLSLPLDPEKKRFWSADRRSFTAAWAVSIDLGFVFWQDFTCHYFVRAVCSV